MTTIDKDRDIARLHAILDSMQGIPRSNYENLTWLQRNIGVKNLRHPDAEEAWRILRRLTSNA